MDFLSCLLILGLQWSRQAGLVKKWLLLLTPHYLPTAVILQGQGDRSPETTCTSGNVNLGLSRGPKEPPGCVDQKTSQGFGVLAFHNTNPCAFSHEIISSTKLFMLLLSLSTPCLGAPEQCAGAAQGWPPAPEAQQSCCVHPGVSVHSQHSQSWELDLPGLLSSALGVAAVSNSNHNSSLSIFSDC